ncbi:ADP-ribosyltransferase domain-containing protein [Microcoleus sp. herbarium14]|uniref:ADP-ribosyltransferase domain-containing protein n=1 Tax=Microcoleus sp. herbarium14 TaxID=3055439 RepID=UPI002FD40196
MPQVKAELEVFESLHAAFDRLKEQLQATHSQVEIDLEETRDRISEALVRAEADAEEAQRAYQECLYNCEEDGSCDREQAQMYRLQEVSEDIRACSQQFERDCDRYQNQSSVVGELLNKAIPRCQDELSDRANIISRMRSILAGGPQGYGMTQSQPQTSSQKVIPIDNHTEQSVKVDQNKARNPLENLDWTNVQTTADERAIYRQRVRQGQHQTYMSESDLNEAVKKATNLPLWPEEMAALIFYSSDNGYKQINSLLRGHLKEFEKNLYDWQTLEQAKNDYLEQARFAAGALNALPNYKLLAFRQTTLSADQIAKYKVGEIVTEHGFTSTSTGIVESEKFQGNVRYTILSQTGKLIQEYAKHPNEKEVLFRPGSKFKVLSVEEKEGKTFIRMMETPNGVELWRYKR